MHAIGIMGGTFDPIHYAHLMIAERAREAFGLREVVFVPAGQPAHKMLSEVTSAEHRYAMTLIATASNPYFKCSRVEIDRRGPSYAVDTVAQLASEYGSDTQLFFIIGSDTIPEILTWHQPERLWSMCRFIAAKRPGFGCCGHNLPLDLLNRIDILETPEMEISSTEIRRRVSKGESIEYLTPEPIVRYIKKYNLYGGDY